MNNASRQIGQVFGAALLGALIYARLPGGSGTGGRLDPARQAAFATGLHPALWVPGIALLAAAPAFGGITQGDGHQLPRSTVGEDV